MYFLGKSKSNRGWSALHLSSYFGHGEILALLLENGGDVNIMNHDGDTPLHKAAFTGRQVINKYPSQVCSFNNQNLIFFMDFFSLNL